MPFAAVAVITSLVPSSIVNPFVWSNVTPNVAPPGGTPNPVKTLPAATYSNRSLGSLQPSRSPVAMPAFSWMFWLAVDTPAFVQDVPGSTPTVPMTSWITPPNSSTTASSPLNKNVSARSGFMLVVPITHTAPAASVPEFAVTTDAGAPPPLPTLTSSRLSAASNVMPAPEMFQISIPLGMEPESVSVYCEITRRPAGASLKVTVISTAWAGMTNVALVPIGVESSPTTLMASTM